MGDHSPKNLMVMTAGLGSRMDPLTRFLPKPFLPVLDTPCLQYAIDLVLETSKVNRMVANLHHLPGQAKSCLNRMERGRIDLQFSSELPLILGSGGGPRQALELLGGEPFFLLNGDVLLDVDLESLWEEHQRLRDQHGVKFTWAILPRTPGETTYGEVRVGSDGLISGIGPKKASVATFVGAAVIEPEALMHLAVGEPADFVTEVLKPCIADGKAGALMLPQKTTWIDMGDVGLWAESHSELVQKWKASALPPQWTERLDRLIEEISPNQYVSRQVREMDESWLTNDLDTAFSFVGSHLLNRVEDFAGMRVGRHPIDTALYERLNRHRIYYPFDTQQLVSPHRLGLFGDVEWAIDT